MVSGKTEHSKCNSYGKYSIIVTNLELENMDKYLIAYTPIKAFTIDKRETLKEKVFCLQFGDDLGRADLQGNDWGLEC